MRLIKSSAIAALVLSAASVFAGSATPHHQPHHHVEHAGYGKLIYGLGFGIGQNNSTLTSTTTAGTTGSTIFGGTSFQGFGFVGYQAELSDAYKVSIQADLGYDSLNKNVHTFGSETIKIKSGFNYGVSARAGMVHGDFTPYLLAGLRIGQWTNTLANSSTTAIAGAHPVGASATVTGKKTLVAPELGAGVNMTLSDNVDARMEYKYFFGGNIVKADTASTINTHTLKARQQSVQFSLVF